MTVRRTLVAAVFLAACRSPEPPPPSVPAPSVAAAPAASPSATVASAAPPLPGAPPAVASAPAVPTATSAPRLLPSPTGDVKGAIRAARVRAKEQGRTLVVYVGAAWCPPCKRFHDDLDAGRLDAPLAGFDFLYLDMDVVKDDLVSAGYATKYIPAFALANGDGSRATYFEVKRLDGKAQDEILKNLEGFRGK